MNRAYNIAKKNQLWSLIKRVGTYYDDDQEFIKEYAKEVYEAYQYKLDEAIACFTDLTKQTETKKAVIHGNEFQRSTDT